MKKITQPARYILHRHLYLFLLAGLAIISSCKKNIEPRALRGFTQVNLVANNNEYDAPHIDPALLNAWGLAFSPTGIPWVNSTGGHVSAVYDKDGAFIPTRPAVHIPSPAGPAGGSPTGIVFNPGSMDFMLTNGQPARFIFVGVDGIVSAWNGPAGDTAMMIQDNSASAAYTGLTLASNGGAPYLYAANFRMGTIDVWDRDFNPVSMPFKDNQLPVGYAPFNIQAVGSWLYVTYARVGPDGHDQAGPGNGFINIFHTDGSLVRRFASRNALNSPWGIAEAPAGFFEEDDHDKDGKTMNQENPSGIYRSNGHEKTILVGNFGDGRISAFNSYGRFMGFLKSDEHAIVIHGLWALSFPPASATTIDPNRLYFTAGPDNEEDGLFGYLIKR